MQRINSSGATADNRFKETPLPATKLAAQWLNAVQEELVAVVTSPTGGNAALNAGNNGQLLAAILAMIGRGVDDLLSVDTGARSFSIGPIVFKIGTYGATFGEAPVGVVFASSFPSACWIVLPIIRNNTSSSGKDIWPQIVGNPTTSGFTLMLQSAGDGGRNSDGFDYLAIGI